MGIIEILLLAIGLAMDACAVSATNGMCYKQLKLKHILGIGIAFGLFQGIMPLIGSLAGNLFADIITSVDHWIALLLLGFIGGKMIIDGIKHSSSCSVKPFTFSLLLMQAVATSIDAFAVGISLAAVQADIIVAVSIIAVVTFALSVIAVYIGKNVGDRLNSKAEIFGGIILVLIGLKIFVEHMFFS